MNTISFEKPTKRSKFQHETPSLSSSALGHGLAQSENIEQTNGEKSTLRTSEDAVCFGMFKVEVSQKVQQECGQNQTRVTVHFHLPDMIRKTSDLMVVGNLNKGIIGLLTGLTNEPSVELQGYYLNAAISQTTNSPISSPMIEVFFIVYGSYFFFDAVGEFFQKWRVYLQDPVQCDRNVPYRNPHRLSGLDDNVCMTLELENQRILESRRLPGFYDPSEIWVTKDIKLETEGPDILRTKLYSHQKQALTFMLRREEGWDLDSSNEDVWKRTHSSRQGTLYTNAITGEHQEVPPTEFRGGLLADPMGLGKSLSMISLIGTDVATYGHDARKSTLLIVPLSLLPGWDDQFLLHTHPETLHWFRYHGPGRHKNNILSSYNVVITTYQTVASEWRQKNKERPLFELCWHRIILDEAHVIRDGSAKMAQAVRSLQGSRRWAMTGTPLQNRLSDLTSLIKFLQIPQFSGRSYFNKNVMCKGDAAQEIEPMGRLIRLVRCISLRRSKTVISLPKRQDKIYRLTFSLEEKTYYDSVREPATKVLEDAWILTAELQTSVLNMINAFRSICNLGLHYRKREVSNLESTWTEEQAQALFEQTRDAGHATCSSCSAGVPGELERLIKETPDIRPWHLTKCLLLYCHRCSIDAYSRHSFCRCKRENPCTLCPVNVQPPKKVDCSPLDLDISFSKPPTKIGALLDDLKIFSRAEKSVVFSQWTSTLDLIQTYIRREDLKFARFDGTMAGTQREDALRLFRTDSETRVMLISITCGAVGIDLTVASRVYLMEPQWNPMIEEQALDRLHRLGQTREVTTIRYIMQDSFEENMRKVQMDKRNLANICLGVTRSENTERLQDYKDLIGISNPQ